MNEWPTFERCPKCQSMLWTDGDRVWCASCEYAFEQGDLFGDA